MLTTVSNCIRRIINPCEYTQVSGYARWAHRRPVPISNQKQYENEQRNDVQQFNDTNVEEEFNNEDHKNTTEIKWKYSSQNNRLGGLSIIRKKSNKRSILRTTSSTFDMLQTVIEANGEIAYTKMADNDPRISMLMTTLKVKNQRARKNLILLEGKRLIKDALECKCKLKYLLFSRKDSLEDLKSALPKSGANIYKMPFKEIQLWSDLTNSPGIMGIFEHPAVENFIPREDPLPLTIICDNIREPGNLGSILRVCAGVGCQHVFLTKGCVDLWDTKVTRGACGAHFRLQIHTKLEWSDIKEKVNARSAVFMADSDVLTLSSAEMEALERVQHIPLLPYYSVSYGKIGHIVLIIGGETEGLSEQAYNFVHDSNGGRLNIPLDNGVESLNSSVAAGIILFEIRKQIVMAKKDQQVASPCTG